MVTHNMQQAVRISDRTAFFLLGELVEYGTTEQLFYHAVGTNGRRTIFPGGLDNAGTVFDAAQEAA